MKKVVMAENSINVSKKLNELLQYLENDSQVKKIDETEIESIFDDLTQEADDSVSTEDFVNMFTEYYVNGDEETDLSGIEEEFMSVFSDIASIDGNSEEFSTDEFDIFLDAVENSNEYNDSGYTNDERIKTDEEGNHYVSAEKWKNDSSVNGNLYNIIKNLYDFDELGVSFSEAYSALLSAIAEKNEISDVNLIYENQKIILVDPYETLGIEKPAAEDIIVTVQTDIESPSEDESSNVEEPTEDTMPSTETDPTIVTDPTVPEPAPEPTSETEPTLVTEPTSGIEPDDDIEDNSEALNSALSDIYAELEKQKSETETKAETKTGFGAVWNAIKGVFGGGTKGELSDIDELEELYESVLENPTEESVKELYETVFGTELDLETVSAGSEISEELTNGTYSINGTEISTEDVVSALEDQVAELDDSFSETTTSQGIISKGVSWLNNNLLGIGTTKNMTQAQIDELSNQVDKLKNASSTEEFASIYKSITGEDLSEESLESLFEGETSKLEDTTAAESMIDYENTTDNIKNTVIAVGVGVATAATGGIAGAFALGVGATVAVNAIDAGTQDNGQSVGENLLEYAQTDMVKDACVGAINGLTGKLGNMAGEKLVSTFAAKKIGSTAATELVETTMEQAAAKGLSTAAQQSAANAALKGTLSTGTRIATEFADGALDAGLSSAGEYVVAAAAGENGNFTNEDGKLIDDDGSLSLFNNFTENFDAKEMAEQVAVSTLMGGVMSAGRQEGMYFLSKGIDSVKSDGGDDVKVGIEGKVSNDVTDSSSEGTNYLQSADNSSSNGTDSTSKDSNASQGADNSSSNGTDSTSKDSNASQGADNSSSNGTDSTSKDSNASSTASNTDASFEKEALDTIEEIKNILENGINDKRTYRYVMTKLHPDSWSRKSISEETEQILSDLAKEVNIRYSGKFR
ncbi:MAG: hypothetical protein LUH05_05090 [Candidatus Gastranaerophilales bacterium]|nr:hypothetical protein [Candidatus Gastranaerophilales bacterium]